jgi:hypothetical protein
MSNLISPLNLKQTDCLNSINTLYEKYKDNEYMLQRIYNHVFLYLPNTLENEEKNHEKRQNLYSYLSEEQQIFMQVFLSKNNYYYLPNNCFYYEYNGLNYYIVKEDDIIHQLLSTISKDRVLLQWKHKTKFNIIKQIKERILFSSIPETDTIQNILNIFYPYIFSSKNAVKYFLTILGDNILKKNSDLIFMVTPKMRQLLDELDSVAMSSIGNGNIAFKFVTKYHTNHSFTNCRLIKTNDNHSNEYWREILKKSGLDLLCVATHYSNRYQNSDNFLNNHSDEELTNYSYTIKNTSPCALMSRFFNDCFEYTTDDFKVEWKNIHFIWKQFLSNNNLPNVIFASVLKNYFTELHNVKYDEETDTFIGITSKYLPVYKEFIQFWNTTMVLTTCPVFENELEIDEISSLFKQWSNNKNVLSEENIIKIIKHFFASEILEDKYVLNMTSNIWNKTNDIDNSIEYIKEQIKEKHKLALVGFDDLYQYYQTYCNNNSLKIVVNKRYFEKYLYYKFSDYIVYEKFVKIEWVHL